MNAKAAKTRTKEMEYGIHVELSDRELLCIGKIVALWGALEYEVFWQALKHFGGLPGGQLPKEMNNMRFSQVLALWETHVVHRTTGKRKKVLNEQCARIRHHHEFRNDLVHGMWDWSEAAPEKITAMRVRKKEILRTQFTADDLESFASELASINFKVRYPGGAEELAIAMTDGAELSRRGFCLMTGNPLADVLLPPLPPKGDDKA
jgi:hypothetical protein